MSRSNKSRVGISVLIIFLSYLSAFCVEHLMVAAIGKQAVADTVFNLSEVYQTIITKGWRKLEQNYTVLVDFDPSLANEPGNPCGKNGTRYQLADLLNKINEQKPAVIVIDKYFPKSCGDFPDEDKCGTGKLRSTLLNISRGTIGATKATPNETCGESPNVVNGGAGELSGVLPNISRETTEAIEATPIIIGRRVLQKEQQLIPSQPSLQFDSPPSSENIKEAIVNIAPDNRRLALEWSVGTKSGINEPKETLAYAAATAYYQSKSRYMPAVPSHLATIKLLPSPYISFINPADLMVIHADSLIKCEGTEQSKCEEHLFHLLRGKVVIIGESSNIDDQHDSLFGRDLAGYTIQANYIEALLDQRYYKANRWLDLVVGFLVFVLIYCSVHNIEKVWKADECSSSTDERIHKKILRTITGFMNLSPENSIRLEKIFEILMFIFLSSLVIFLLLIAVVVVFGTYINPDTLSFQAIIIILTHLILPKTQEHEE